MPKRIPAVDSLTTGFRPRVLPPEVSPFSSLLDALAVAAWLEVDEFAVICSGVDTMSPTPNVGAIFRNVGSDGVFLCDTCHIGGWVQGGHLELESARPNNGVAYCFGRA